MEIVFLGTGGSFPSPQRGVSAVAIKANGEVLLFDCGEGTQRQLMRSSLSFMGITKIFITHFHGDHYLGLAGLLQTMALNGRTKDLEIFGPSSRRMTDPASSMLPPPRSWASPLAPCTTSCRAERRSCGTTR